MTKQALQTALVEKKEQLNDAISALKSEFIALDGIIDEIGDLMLPWWLFPDSQLRPSIINLWGMTGSGKTALVRRLADHLGYDHLLLRFDMGEYGQSGTFLKYTLTGQLYQFNNKAPIILLDEFQFAKTLDESGREANNIALRIIWDLLDSGVINFEGHVNTYYTLRGYKALRLINECLNQGVEIRDGIIIQGADIVKKIFGDFVFGYHDGSIERSEGEGFSDAEFFVSDLFCTGIYEIKSYEYGSYRDAADRIRTFNSLYEIIHYITQIIQDEEKPKVMNLSKALIFVVGNLDEAYYMSSNINPDISPDEFHRNTKKINIADIKFALQKRFRNEQLARLGNNHLIYHAFTTADYYQFIDLSLARLGAQVEERYNIRFEWDKSIKRIIFKEGVFPTQGVRPVMSTIRNLVESYISKLLLYLIENNLDSVERINWSYKRDRYVFRIHQAKRKKPKELTLPVRLKVNSLRKSVNDDLQSQVAVHESGHALLSIFSTGILPEYIITRTVDSESQGFTYIRLPEDITSFQLIKDMIKIGLGGYLAEKNIFGAENTSAGVSLDIRRLTELAHLAVRDYGMGTDPIRTHLHTYGGSPYQSTFTDQHELMVNALIEQCRVEAEAVVENHRELLLEMSWYLSGHSRIEKTQILKMIQEYCAKKDLPMIPIIDAKAYFNFKATLQQLRK
jgi:cell division protease FtsH